MKISHIEHLGIAVKSIEEALPYYENVLGFKCYNIETVEDQKVKTAFLKVGETKIELLEPTSPESTIAKFIENKGEGIHHIAYAVEDGIANALFMDVGLPFRKHGYRDFVLQFGGKQSSSRRWFRVRWKWLNKVLCKIYV